MPLKAPLKWVLEKTGWLGAGVLAFMVASIAYDVSMRYVFASPTSWALEVNTFLLAFLSIVPAGDVLWAKSHIRVGFFAERMPEGLKRLVALVRGLAGIFFCAVMTWKGWVMAINALQHNDRMSTSLGTPMVIPYMFIPVGFGLMGLYYLAFLFAPDVGRKPGVQSSEMVMGSARERDFGRKGDGVA